MLSAVDLVLLSTTELNVLCFVDNVPKLEEDDGDSKPLVVARLSLDNDIASDG